jgi:thiamine pyrophosphokinase
MARAAVIVIGGLPPSSGVLELLPAGAYVIAADSGLDHAIALGLRVDALVGDLDSVSPEALHLAEQAGIDVHRHPTAKDATDTELAIDLAVERGYDPIIGVTGGGERIDHALGALLAFASPVHGGAHIEVLWELQRVQVLHGPGELTIGPAAPGDLVSILPVHGDVVGVSTQNLAYPLRNETLAAGSARGLSNIHLGDCASVTVGRGTILVITPSPLTTQERP